DHDVTPLWMLPMFTAMCVREGLPEDAAFRAITINPAKMLGVADRVGSICPGKDADIVVFDGHPFHYLTRVKAVFINGKKTD
ncbi:MAG: amidohydrolase family protein, partial [Clostridia bacterium]|nr:amidohydrolase family protein [Clostridia bacterium]